LSAESLRDDLGAVKNAAESLSVLSVTPAPTHPPALGDGLARARPTDNYYLYTDQTAAGTVANGAYGFGATRGLGAMGGKGGRVGGPGNKMGGAGAGGGAAAGPGAAGGVVAESAPVAGQPSKPENAQLGMHFKPAEMFATTPATGLDAQLTPTKEAE